MIRAAIVGLGWWGQVLAKAIHGKSGKIAVIRGVTRTPSRAAAFSDETGIPVDADFEALLTENTIDALILATPHSQHVAQIEAAAAAGKHVFVEKPLALTAEGAARAFDACRAAGVVLAVGQNRRFLPAVADLKAMVGSGVLGRILHVEGNFSGPSGYRHKPGVWRATGAESPSGGMTGKGLHLTDLMIDMFGPPAEVDARSFRQVLEIDMDDTTAMLIRFASGQTGYLGTLTATPADWRLQVYGSKGWAEIRRERFLTTATLDTGPETREFPETDIEFLELEAFADAISGGAPFPVRRAQAVANVALLEAIGASAGAGVPVTIDLPE